MANVFDSILQAAAAKGMGRADLAHAAGMHPASLSRVLKNGRCQFRTVELLAHTAGLRLVCVEDNELGVNMAQKTNDAIDDIAIGGKDKYLSSVKRDYQKTGLQRMKDGQVSEQDHHLFGIRNMGKITVHIKDVDYD
jgi:hypothetical protein